MNLIILLCCVKVRQKESGTKLTFKRRGSQINVTTNIN